MYSACSGGERVEHDAEGRELEPRHLHVDLLGDVVHALGQLGVLAAQPLRGERLVGEAHVHDRGRVALGGAEVDEPALGQDVQPATAEVVLDHVLADLADPAAGQLRAGPAGRSRRRSGRSWP